MKHGCCTVDVTGICRVKAYADFGVSARRVLHHLSTEKFSFIKLVCFIRDKSEIHAPAAIISAVGGNTVRHNWRSKTETSVTCKASSMKVFLVMKETPNVSSKEGLGLTRQLLIRHAANAV